MLAFVTLPGLESFLIGECKRVGVATGEVADGWVLGAAAAAPQAGPGTLRGIVDVVWTGPAEQVPQHLPLARLLRFEGQIINGAARCASVRDTVVRASGGPALAAAESPDAVVDMVCIVNRQGVVLIGRPLTWGLERHRPYRVALMARSLNPAMARAMAMASRARPGDTLLDPCCGSGTILAERALLGPCRLVGRDIDPAAIDAARRTLAALPAMGPAQRADAPAGDGPDGPALTTDVRVGDARALDLGDGSVTAVASNLPFGHRMGGVADNALLYPAALREAARVLRPRCRLVVLSADRRHLRLAIEACGAAWRLRSAVRTYLGGLEPTLAVYDRTEAPIPPPDTVQS